MVTRARVWLSAFSCLIFLSVSSVCSVAVAEDLNFFVGKENWYVPEHNIELTVNMNDKTVTLTRNGDSESLSFSVVENQESEAVLAAESIFDHQKWEFTRVTDDVMMASAQDGKTLLFARTGTVLTPSGEPVRGTWGILMNGDFIGIDFASKTIVEKDVTYPLDFLGTNSRKYPQAMRVKMPLLGVVDFVRMGNVLVGFDGTSRENPMPICGFIQVQ